MTFFKKKKLFKAMKTRVSMLTEEIASSSRVL
jgi:hypothetical protein